MKKFTNKCHIEGRVYSCNLEQRVTGEASKNPGTEYIRGDISIATDEAGLNIVKCVVTYLTRFTNKGTENATYTTLYNIMTKGKTWTKDGKDEAIKLRVDGSIGVNDFIAKDGSMINQQIVSLNFAHLTEILATDETKRATFDTDIVIGRVSLVEGDPEKKTNDHAEIVGYAFDFRGGVVPIQYQIEDKNGVNYFLGLNASSSNPFYTPVSGNIISQNISRETVKQSAFGAPQVVTSTTSKRLYLITWAEAQENLQPFGTEETITAEEFKKALADREIVLAGVQERFDNRSTTTQAEGAFTPGASDLPPFDDFKF